MNKLSLLLAGILYLLIFIARYQQVDQKYWEPKLDLFISLRSSLDTRIESLLPSPQAELLSGILLGQNKNLPTDLKLALRDTSTLHIVVASGQNLSLVAGFFLALAGLIKRRTALILGLVAAIFYTLLSGMQIPIIRALIMFGLACLAQITGRQKDGVWVLLITAGLMLLVNPSWVTSLSFQLSFLATLGVIAVAPVLLKYFKSLPLLGQDLAVTLGAQLMVMPVIIQNFHQLSLVGILANLLIGWTIPFIMVFGSLMLLLGFMDIFTNVLLSYFIYIVKFFASLPFAWEYIGEQSWVIWLGYYMLVASVVVLLNNAKTTTGK